jgi:hypothetical protein
MERINQAEPRLNNWSRESNFTQIPNDILRNPELSSKAKIVLCLFLSNRKGWVTHISSLGQYLKEGESAIKSALSELKSNGYYIKLVYRNKISKKIVGTACGFTDTPWEFNVYDTVKSLSKNGFELVNSLELNRPVENRTVGNPPGGFYTPLIILNKEKIFKKGGTPGGNENLDENKKDPEQILLSRLESNGKETDQRFHPAFIQWLRFKRGRGQSYKDVDSTHMAYNKLVKISNNNPKTAKEVVEQSMSNNWAGLFALDTPNQPKTGGGKAPVKNDGRYRSPGKVYKEHDREI